MEIIQAWSDAAFKGYGHMLIAGVALTVQLALLSYAVGLVLGLLGAWAKLSSNRFARLAAEAYTTVVRGIPELVLLLLLYYGSAILINWLLSLAELDPIDLSSFAAGATALGIICGGYLTETLRGAILAVPKGQMEAAYAHGMRPALAFRRILLPQLWRYALPGMGNTWLVLLKDTSIVSAIGLHELMWGASTGGSNTRLEFRFLLAACVLYLLVTAVSNVVFHTAERYTSRGVIRR